jgi:hypothetical protein
MNKFFKSTRVTMKKILLSSAAIVAFAGAAAADVSFSGSATLGYNEDHEGGFYADSDLDITASAELNNGWTAALTYGLELENLENGVFKSADADNNFDGNLLLSLTNGTYGLYYGDTAHAAESLWDGVSEMAADGFSEQDAEEVLKFTATFGEIETAYSVDMVNDGVATTEAGQQSFGAAGSFGSVNFALGYQDETDFLPAGSDGDYFPGEIIGLTVGTSFAGADVKVSYAKASLDALDAEATSMGIEASYPVGPVTLTAFYVDEEASIGSVSADGETYGVSAAYADGPIDATLSYKSVLETETVGLEGSYAVSDELSVFAGYIDSDDLSKDGSYIGVSYDLGGGASVLASYADVDDSNSSDDEFGAQDYKAGATVQIALSF